MNLETLSKLTAPIPGDQIRWRVGKVDKDQNLGRAMPYIDARVVQNRLDEVVGPFGWKNSFVEVFSGSRLLAVRCLLSLKDGEGQWLTKEDAAYMSTRHDSDESAEIALKGVYSDALKRAAVHWGIGRQLYEFRAPWVQLDEHGRLAEIPSLDGGPAVKVGSPTEAVEAERTLSSEPVVSADGASNPSSEPTVSAAPAAPVESAPAAQPPAVAPAPAPMVAPAPAPATAAVTAAAPSGQAMDEAAFRAGNATLASVLDRLAQKAVPVQVLRGYVTGPRSATKFNDAERAFLVARLNAAENDAKQAEAAATPSA